MAEAAGKKKIAILGGGPAAIVAAFELSSQPGWQEKYDITMYSLGWRLGGKCATGRGEDGRIEEHGWHTWFGCYENAFHVMRRCYDELGRVPGEKFATWQEAFHKHSSAVSEQVFNGQWVTHQFNLPENDEIPGSSMDEGANTEDAQLLPLTDYIDMALQLVYQQFLKHEKSGKFKNKGQVEKPDWWHQLLGQIEVDAEYAVLSLAGKFIHAASMLFSVIGKEPLVHIDSGNSGLVWLIDQFQTHLYKEIESELNSDFDLYNLWVMSDMVLTNIKGIILDDLPTKGLNSINDIEYVAWMRKHGLSDIAYKAWPTRGLYDACYSYKDGRSDQPNMAAGIALHLYLRMVFTYRGAYLWEMQAGMGETVMSPFYIVLKRRGVKFEFFSKVENLGLGKEKKTIETIQIGRQVTLKGKEYKPLIEVEGLACWPSEPLYDQIVDEQAKALKDGNINLESFWTPWQNAETKTLKVGQDFDLVVLGIPIAALPFVCKELIETSQKWKDMVDNVRACQTIGLQFWFKPTTLQLGGPDEMPLFTGFAEPFNNWVDLTYLLPYEGWPVNDRPGGLVYATGQMDTAPEIPPVSDHDFPAREQARANALVRDFIKNNIRTLFPGLMVPGKPDEVNWDLFVAPDDVVGEDRLNHQVIRVNCDPSERVSLSLAGTNQYRIKTNETGFDNLFICGDWIDTGINIAAVEVATISGRQASRAICGEPKIIVGESGF